MSIMTSFHVNIIGNRPSATRPGNAPASPRVESSRFFMKFMNGAWQINGMPPGMNLPPSTFCLFYEGNEDKPSPSPSIPPSSALPSIHVLEFYNVSMRSLSDIPNLDTYAGSQTLSKLSFFGCDSLVIDDLSWFASLPVLDDLNLVDCKITSLAGLERFPKPISLSIADSSLDLATQIGTIEAYWHKHGGKMRKAGDISIGGCTIGGRKVQKTSTMQTATAVGYIRGRMAMYGLS